MLICRFLRLAIRRRCWYHLESILSGLCRFFGEEVGSFDSMVTDMSGDPKQGGRKCQLVKSIPAFLESERSFKSLECRGEY